MMKTKPSERQIPICRYLFGINSGIEHMAIWQKPPPNPEMASPAVNCIAFVDVAEITKPMAHMTFPASRKIRRPKRSLFVPARRNPIALHVVYAGTSYGRLVYFYLKL
jgi:hypothetical protein